MKVIMLVDEEPFGKRGEVKEVRNGLARNYLLPKRLAIEATPGNIKNWELQKRASMTREARIKEEAQNLATKLEGIILTIPVKAGGEEKILAAPFFSPDSSKVLYGARKGNELWWIADTVPN